MKIRSGWKPQTKPQDIDEIQNQKQMEPQNMEENQEQMNQQNIDELQEQTKMQNTDELREQAKQQRMADGRNPAKQQWSERILGFGIFALLPVMGFFLMEAYEHNAFVEVRPQAIAFSILLLELIAWLLYFVVGRINIAAGVELALMMIFGLVNHYVMAFRSTPFVPWDIFSVGTAASVMGNYDFTPTFRVVLVTLGFVVLMGVAFVALRRTPKINWKVRIVAALAVLSGLCFFVHLLQQEEFQTKHYLYPFLFTPAYMTKVNGMAVTFAMDLAYVAVDKPKGYDAGEAEAFLEKYENLPEKEGEQEIEGKQEADDASTNAAGSDELPNIIVIMDEAFSDLSVLGNLTTNEDVMPFMHQMQQGADNAVTGYAQVSVCGGNTANSEFEFLTGNTMAFLPAGSIPYQQYIKSKTPSLASYLKSLGYETYAQHPYYASGWNRNQVYPLLGFDHMDFLPDYTNADFVRKYVSDASDMQHIIDTFENKEPGKPMFLFNVTMQNHGGYTEDYPNFQADVHSGYNSQLLDRYLSLVRLSDQALEELTDYFSVVKEKTVVLFFGDHQPADAVVAPFYQDPLQAGALELDTTLRYQVPYLLWANFDIEGESGKNTSLNYLAAQMLEKAGIPTNGYQNYLLEQSRSYPVLSAAGQKEQGGVSSDELLDYQKLQYYQLFERNRE